MPTIKEIAAKVGVSLSTVSRVLNLDDTMLVSAETRRLIVETAHEMGYVPPKLRRRSGLAHITIGIADWKIIQRGQSNAHIASLHYLIQSITKEAEVSFIRLDEHSCEHVDGMIAFGHYEPQEIDALQRMSYHIVFVDSNQEDYLHDQIIIDFTLGMKQMVEYLIQERHCKTIGYIGGLYEDANTRIGYHRLQSLTQCLRDMNAYDPGLIKVKTLTHETGYTGMKEFINSESLPDAILLGNDIVAEGALHAIAEDGISVPEDLKIVLYNDIETLKQSRPDYTCIKMYPDFVWQTAIELLIERVLNRRTQTMKIIIPTRLLIGSST